MFPIAAFVPFGYSTAPIQNTGFAPTLSPQGIPPRPLKRHNWNKRAPLFVPSGVKIANAIPPPNHRLPVRPAARNPVPAAAASPPKAAPKSSSPPAEPKKSDPAAHNGVLNIQPPLYVPSNEERREAEEKAAAKFWKRYWEKEAARLERLANSVFPEPLPRPPIAEDEDNGPTIRPASHEKIDPITHMAALMENVARFIGI